MRKQDLIGVLKPFSSSLKGVKVLRASARRLDVAAVHVVVNTTHQHSGQEMEANLRHAPCSFE